ncbi:MAG TPA: type II toxin-antitoxin system VapB family antitoxin [Chloroflexota bacterium]|nr:type II toxin-antitoxin system VapB family antitoxin [Chloroflexota bacterium]
MGLNIKNEETLRLVRALAELTGENMTTAVNRAVRERLDHLQSEKGSLADRLMALGQDCAAHMREPYLTLDHGDLLYDDRGLPK